MGEKLQSGQNFLIEDKRRHGTEKIKAAYSKRNTTVCMRYLERSNLFHDNKMFTERVVY